MGQLVIAAGKYDGEAESDLAVVGQPWREYWPPEPGSPRDIRLRAEFPELSTWKFDNSRIFERPWKAWTIDLSPYDGVRVPMPLNPPQDEPSRAAAAPDMMTPQPHLAINPATLASLDREIIQRGLHPAIPRPAFNYLAPVDEWQRRKPYKLQVPCIDGFPRTNLAVQQHDVNLYEISGCESMFSLDIAGFEYAQCLYSHRDWTNAGVEREYLPTISKWLRDYLKCDRVFVYDYNVSSSEDAEVGTRSEMSYRVCYDAIYSSDDTVLGSPLAQQPLA